MKRASRTDVNYFGRNDALLNSKTVCVSLYNSLMSLLVFEGERISQSFLRISHGGSELACGTGTQAR